MKAEAPGWLIRGSEGQRRQRPRLPFGVQHPHFLRNPPFTGGDGPSSVRAAQCGLYFLVS